MKRILITAGSSYLGQHLVPIVAENFKVCYTYFEHDPLGLPEGRQLDVLDEANFIQLATNFRPHVIIQLAGSNRGPNMREVIVQAAQSATAIAHALNARLIHISTDSLLDGRNAPYHEADFPSPITDYGLAKAEAESLVARHNDQVTIRTSLIYGLEIMDHSTSWVSDKLKNDQPVTLFTNQIRQPIWAKTLSLACLELVDLKFQGIINIAGRQAMSRAEFGLKLLNWWGETKRDSLYLGPAGMDWPLDCRMDLTLAGEILSTPMLGLDEVLAANSPKRGPNHKDG